VKIAVKIILPFVFIFVAGFGVGSSITSPEHAIIYIDESTETYLSPSCVSKSKTQFMAQMTIKDVRNLTLSINKECVNRGGFVQNGRSFSGKLLESLGFIPKLKERWNNDGSWNW